MFDFYFGGHFGTNSLPPLEPITCCKFNQNRAIWHLHLSAIRVLEPLNCRKCKLELKPCRKCNSERNSGSAVVRMRASLIYSNLSTGRPTGIEIICACSLKYRIHLPEQLTKYRCPKCRETYYKRRKMNSKGTSCRTKLLTSVRKPH